MQPRSRKRRPSDAPPDLAGEREEFLRTFLRKGARFTEELLEEHQALQKRVGELEEENAKLRTHLASSDAIRDLLRTIETLEREREALIERVHTATSETHGFQRRYTEIENEFNDLATLYVASFQLHSTLRLKSVARHLKELLLQFVGAERFALFLLDENGRFLRPAAAEGVELALLPPVLPGEGAIGEAFSTGILSIRDPDGEPASIDAPLACIPLRVDDYSVGVIAIFGLLAQKNRLVRVDRELFELLIPHAATALVAANLFARVTEPERFLAGLDAGVWPATKSESNG